MTHLRNLVIVPVLALTSCDTGTQPAAGAAVPAPKPGKGIVLLSPEKKELSFSATFHRANAEEGTWHLIVEGDGSMASQAMFTTDVSPALFYSSLRDMGAVDANNVTPANFGDENIATAGDRIEFLIDRADFKSPLTLEQFLEESVPNLPSSGGARGLEMRFGGNCTREDAASPPCHASGCLACLYTCSAGVTSSSRANLALLKRENNVHRYRLRSSVTLPDKARVRILVRVAGK